MRWNVDYTDTGGHLCNVWGDLEFILWRSNQRQFVIGL